MKNLRVLSLAAVFIFGLCLNAQAQIPGSGVQQKGSVTANDCASWVQNGVIQDSGAPCGTGSGTVTSVSVTTANGVSATVANPTTTPALTFTLGAITPSSAAIGAGSAITSSGPGGALTAVAFASFGTASGNAAQGGVITAGGPTGSATVAPVITYNAAGQLTTVSSATITPAIGSVTGLGTGVATALAATLNGSGSLTATTSPAFVTPTLGAASATTLNFPNAGSVNAPLIIFGNGGTNFGFFLNAGAIDVAIAGFSSAYFGGSAFNLPSTSAYAFSSTNQADGGTYDTHISREVAGRVQFGTTSNNNLGTIDSSGYYAAGTKGVTCSGALTIIASITITDGIITAATGTGGTCS